MKYFIFILVTGVFNITGYSQKPEKIYGNARHHLPVKYYKEQAALWKKEVDKDPKDANAWYNYYNVIRNLMFNDTLDNRHPAERNKELLKIVDDMEKNIPDSYEFNISKWQANAFNNKYLPYLKKAAALGQDRTEHIDYMINQGELTRTISDRELYSIKKFEADQFSSGVIYYNYNVIIGLEKNAIIFTGGDNDTYPIWYLQSQGIRKDITVINLYLIELEDYREKLFNELGIEKWQKAPGEMTKDERIRFRSGIVKHVSNNKKKYPVYVGLTSACDEHCTKTIDSNLYLTGLAYLYSEKNIDDMAIIKNNVEHLYAFDYLDKSFYQDISPDIVKIVNGNYIIPFLKLYDHYKLSGEIQKAEAIKTKLILVSKGTENETEVMKCLAEKQ